jgi:hypothetical protein
MIRAFLAHKKPAEDLEALRLAVRDRLLMQNPGVGSVVVVLGVEDHDRNFMERGSWDAWCAYVVSRADVVTRTPYYAVIVVPVSDSEAEGGEICVGKATALIVKYAHEARRPIAVFGRGVLHAVTGGYTINSEDWKAGWALNFEPIKAAPRVASQR